MVAERLFALPDVGEGLTEAEILRWHVAPGDEVQVNQVIVEIETAKASVELPCPFAGKVLRLHVQEGDLVRVGAPIIGIEGSDGDEAPNGRQAVLVGYGVRPDTPGRRRRRASSAQPAVAGTAVRAKPPVRKLARDLGVDLRTVRGTGAGGVVTREDVLAAEGVATKEVRDLGPGRRVPVRGVQRAMADAMVRSAFTAPHVMVWLDVDLTDALQVVEQLRADPRFTGIKVTPLTLIAAAVVASAQEYSAINASWINGPPAEIHHHAGVHLGIAVDTDRGLLVPSIKDAQALDLPTLAAQLDQLIHTARAGECSAAQLTGSTITITNIGVFGVAGGTPIINPGESAILAVGAIAPRPWVIDGRIEVRQVATLSLSFDHRIVDGAAGSRALAAIASRVAEPWSIASD